jgi:hypothetical protein
LLLFCGGIEKFKRKKEKEQSLVGSDGNRQDAMLLFLTLQSKRSEESSFFFPFKTLGFYGFKLPLLPSRFS